MSTSIHSDHVEIKKKMSLVRSLGTNFSRIPKTQSNIVYSAMHGPFLLSHSRETTYPSPNCVGTYQQSFRKSFI